jgi:hypothetical protein
MKRERFDEYVRRFNAEDASVFDEFLTPDMRMQNGGLHYQGIEGMKAHYGRIWGRFRETLAVRSFVADERHLAVHLNTHFEALVDDAQTPFGSVRRGEAFDYDGIVFYDLRDGRFSAIKVSYLSFIKTGLDGVKHSLGLAH